MAIMILDDFDIRSDAHPIKLAKRKGKLQLVCRYRSDALENWLTEHNATLDIRFTSRHVYYNIRDDDLATLAYLMFK